MPLFLLYFYLSVKITPPQPFWPEIAAIFGGAAMMLRGD